VKLITKSILLILIPFILQATTLVGTSKGSGSVSQGVFSYSIDVLTPKGTAGVKLPLSIGYSSSNSNNSILGVGFSLSGLSSIIKCSEQQLEEIADKSRDYNYCLDGKKLLLLDTSQTYGANSTEYRTEINNQAKVLKRDDHWLVYTKDGLIYQYGATSDSRDGEIIYRVNEIKDRYNNSIYFKYSANEGEKNIQSISYSNNTVEFIYEDREDSNTLYTYDVKINLNKRLKKIAINTGGKELSSYNFNYEYINQRSTLVSMQEYAKDIALEPLEFNWEKDHNLEFAERKSWLDVEQSESDKWNIYLQDIDADSLPDMIQSYKGDKGHIFKVSLNSGTSFGEAKEWFSDSNSDLKEWEIYTQDINSDGLPDLIQSYKGEKGGILKVSLNSGTSFGEAKDWYNDDSISYKDYNIYLKDMNSDSRVDLVRTYKGSDGHKFSVALHNGNGFDELKEWYSESDSKLKDYEIYAQDINGDGLPDMVQSYKGSNGHKFRVALHDGSGFGSVKEWYSNSDSTLSNWDIYTQDINGDGLPDLIQSYNRNGTHKLQVSLNSGSKFGTTKEIYNKNLGSDWSIYLQDINNDHLPDIVASYKGSKGHQLKISHNRGDIFNDEYELLNHTETKLKDYEIYFQDVDGDGLLDVVQSNKKSNKHNLQVSLNTNSNQLITNITNNRDQSIDIEYSTLLDKEIYTPYSGSSYPQIDIKASSMPVVKTFSVVNSVDTINTMSYKYEGFRADFFRGSLGFAKVSSSDHASDEKIVTEYMQEYPYVGVVDASYTYIDGIKLVDTSSKIRTIKYHNNKNILNIESYENKQNKYDIDGTYLYTTKTIKSDYDKYANIGKIESITTNNKETYKKITTNNYNNYESTWILARLTDAQVDHIGNDGTIITKSSSFVYDSVTGTLIKETIEPNSDKYISKRYIYDPKGNRIQEQIEVDGENPRITKFVYDSIGKNQISIENGLGHIEHREYDIYNNVIRITGPNGISTSFEYDELNRKIKEIRADGTVSTMEYSWDNSIPFALYKITAKSTGVMPVTTYFDKAAKKIRVAKVGFNGVNIYEDTHYNALGQVYKHAMPYYGTDVVNYIYNYYDKLGRQIKLTRISREGKELHTYYEHKGLSVTTINPKGYKKTVTNNIQDKKIKVVDEGIYIEYEYDAAGNLIQTTDSKNNKIKIKYDIYGNKIEQNDPDMGIWTYEYNALGELVSQTDAKGQTKRLEYDELGRLIKKISPEGEAVYVYDIAHKGIGKLAYESQDGYKKEYYYDRLGRVSHTITHIDGKEYKTALRYRDDGKVDETIYPNGFVLKNEYNRYGYLKALKSPKGDNLGYSKQKLKPLIEKALAKKKETFENIIALNGQIQQYRIKAMEYLTLAEKYKDSNTKIYNQLNETSNLLIKSAIELGNMADTHKSNYDEYKRRLKFYLNILNSFGDEYLYKWIVDKQYEYTSDLIDEALSKLESAKEYLANIKTAESLKLYKEITHYFIDEAKSIIQEAKSNADSYKSFRQKYLALEANSSNSEFRAMFDDEEYNYYYKILAADVLGRVTKDMVGNGLVTTREFDPSTGHLNRIQTGYKRGNDIRDIEYEYDSINSMTKKLDHHQEITQTYEYDNLDRVTSATTIQNNKENTLTYRYDSTGNITYKSDVGEYIYQAAHQVSRAGANTYTYDANGNVIKKNNLNIEYNSDNKPISMYDDKNRVEFRYAPNKQRYKKILNGNSTIYIGKVYEVENTNKTQIRKNFIYAGNELIAIHTTEDKNNLSLPQTRYLHKDSLGSVDTITNQSGVVLQRLAYNPYGKQLTQSWFNQSTSTPLVKRGYTGHEHMREFSLINMNARIYDPTIGRFLSADSMIPYPSDPRSYNRYSYVRNNPLKYVDPSGHFGFKKFAMIAVAIAITYVTAGAAAYLMTGATSGTIFAALANAAWYYQAAAMAIGAFVSTAIQVKHAGGSTKQAFKAGLKSAVVAAVSAGVAKGVGYSINEMGIQNAFLRETVRGVMHGITRVAISKASGNGEDARATFTAAFISSVAMHNTPAAIGNNYYAELAYSMVIGGTVSEVAGGNFANGAASAAFSFMFNKKGQHDKFKNPTGKGIRKCDIKYGCGHYGASRDQGTRKHLGVDYISTPGQDVYSPISGKIIKFDDPYDDIPSLKGKFGNIHISNNKYYVVVNYVKQKDISEGTYINAGDIVAVAQDLHKHYSAEMTNHVHVTMYQQKPWKRINPTNLIPLPSK
jgi:RHS repeat-associated protein